jgi:hypothetical protein
MEHLLFALIAETISAIDRRLQRPLGSVIPNLPYLRTQPEQYLSVASVQVGPRRRHALATFWGIVAGLILFVILVVILANAPRPRVWHWGRITGVLLSVAVTFWIVRSLLLRWLSGGTATLRAQGIELAYRKRVAFLPWSLFRAEGNLFEPDTKMAVLPIDPSVPVAISGPDSDVRAIFPAEMNLPQAQSGDSPHLALRDLYEVRISELAVLFLEIGRRLRNGTTAESAVPYAVVPIAVPDQDGWLVLQLTQLPMPPYCASCGSITSQNLELTTMKYGQSTVVKIPIPFCTDCAAARRRAQWTGAIVGFTVALIIAGGLVSYLFGPLDFVEWCVLTLLVGGGLGVLGAFIGVALRRENRLPIKLRDYRPDKGTVRIRFRDPYRAAPLLNSMGLQVNEPNSSSLVD